jgi:hypothetical protein
MHAKLRNNRNKNKVRKKTNRFFSEFTVLVSIECWQSDKRKTQDSIYFPKKTFRRVRENKDSIVEQKQIREVPFPSKYHWVNKYTYYYDAYILFALV